jgi:hypothetical protein
MALHNNRNKDYIRKSSKNARSSDKRSRKKSVNSNNNIRKNGVQGNGEGSQRDRRVSRNSHMNSSNLKAG